MFESPHAQFVLAPRFFEVDSPAGLPISRPVLNPPAFSTWPGGHSFPSSKLDCFLRGKFSKGFQVYGAA